MTAVTVAEYIPTATPGIELVRLTKPTSTYTYTSQKFMAVNACLYGFVGPGTGAWGTDFGADANHEYYATVSGNTVTLTTASGAHDVDIYLLIFGANLGGT